MLLLLSGFKPFKQITRLWKVYRRNETAVYTVPGRPQRPAGKFKYNTSQALFQKYL